MRIRKRKMLFPQSSLPDPLVQFHDSHRTPQTLISLSQDNKIHSDQQQQHQEQESLMKMQEEKKDVEEDKKQSNDTKNESIYGAEYVTGIQPQPSDSSSLGNAFPFVKKRRGSYSNKAADEDRIMNEKNKSVMSKMKTKMNKKSVIEHEPNDDNATEDKDGAKKKVNQGGVLMEGSRCSRVNGRGWRCSQPTLVGYSLCEHHLGKGRLRSMNSVKGKFLIGSSTKQESADQPLSSNMKNEMHEDEDDEPLMVTKNKIKLGIVKAKSISSLLGQTDRSAVEADNCNE